MRYRVIVCFILVLTFVVGYRDARAAVRQAAIRLRPMHAAGVERAPLTLLPVNPLTDPAPPF